MEGASASSLEGTVAFKTVRNWFCACPPDMVVGIELAPEMALTPLLSAVAHPLTPSAVGEQLRGHPSGDGVRKLPTDTTVSPAMKNDSLFASESHSFRIFI